MSLIHNVVADVSYGILEDVWETDVWQQIVNESAKGQPTGWIYDLRSILSVSVCMSLSVSLSVSLCHPLPLWPVSRTAFWKTWETDVWQQIVNKSEKGQPTGWIYDLRERERERERQ
jgi:hypothetical protein